ncbi:hypothetical protein [Sporosarcina sp. Te-1]|uniref:hypothetical protein n=1 Tax=Sporosarcina sp. Te-1 TaxID=2818390 RepID=UPI001A9E866E|nr:hypothetical protein [Sporosarcina sp. Te-1]QTD40923.1 hypothetical protein J3U78_19630 [Sporosarcina sp. Te-1]
MNLKKFSFLILLAVAALLVAWQSKSFPDTELQNEMNDMAIHEEEILLSVQYGEGREFWVGNNTDQQVEIQGSGFVAKETSRIGPGMFKAFILTGHPEELMNGTITVHGLWNEGGVKVESLIPQANMNFILQELDESPLVGSRGGQGVTESEEESRGKDGAR